MADTWLRLRILKIHLQNALVAWRAETKFDERMCCSGRECGCQGETWRSFWEYELRKDRPRRYYGTNS